jgi:murein DD-endopeptidase MepM/ murein hydrolase activator NlpD
VTEIRAAAIVALVLAVPASAPAQTSAHAAPVSVSSAAAAIEELRARGLEVPVRGIAPDELRDSFDGPRGGGRRHQAIDILAPRGTPVLAVDDGTIRRLSPANGGGGIVVYQVDPSGSFVYYYAHLERWANGLAVGDAVVRGQVIGHVGTSGNAPPGTPHLHFAIYRLDPGDDGWRGPAVNPFAVYR